MVAYHPLNVLVGTSGYSYKEWKGAFYPRELKDAEMLRFYAERFPTVEINNTFYKMPTPELLARWGAEVPAGFRFVLKAPRRITHEKRLAGAADTTARLRDFVGLLPAGTRAAFEFRDPTWDDDEVREALRARGAALCLADTDDDQGHPRLVPTARFGYLRLRRTGYDDDALRAWADRIRAQPWDEAFVFFKHEDEARGPQLAQRLIEMLRG